MHGNLRFYYVQQPCLDYVLFLGFFEVISFSLSDISSGLMVSIEWGRVDGMFDRRIPAPESTQTCIPFSSHVIFRKNTSLGEGWGSFFIMVKNKVLIIVDMILSWKILWFQRVSEHVLELGHYEIKESKVCITHFDCVKKTKHILNILSFRCSWKYTCTVYFLL